MADSCQCMAKTTAAAAAKLLQLCLTLCDPIDSSPPGSPIPGFLQARILEWVAITLSGRSATQLPPPSPTPAQPDLPKISKRFSVVTLPGCVKFDFAETGWRQTLLPLCWAWAM